MVETRRSSAAKRRRAPSEEASPPPPASPASAAPVGPPSAPPPRSRSGKRAEVAVRTRTLCCMLYAAPRFQTGGSGVGVDPTDRPVCVCVCVAAWCDRLRGRRSPGRRGRRPSSRARARRRRPSTCSTAPWTTCRAWRGRPWTWPRRPPCPIPEVRPSVRLRFGFRFGGDSFFSFFIFCDSVC